MKIPNKTPGKILIIACVLFISNATNAQPDEATVKTCVDSKQFIFHPQTALSASGRGRQLTSEYDLRVIGDSLVSNLPFYGRAYSATYGSSDGGFNFTSTKFEYAATPGKKKGWNISIKPK